MVRNNYLRNYKKRNFLKKIAEKLDLKNDIALYWRITGDKRSVGASLKKGLTLTFDGMWSARAGRSKTPGCMAKFG